MSTNETGALEHQRKFEEWYNKPASTTSNIHIKEKEAFLPGTSHTPFILGFLFGVSVGYVLAKGTQP